MRRLFSTFIGVAMFTIVAAGAQSDEVRQMVDKAAKALYGPNAPSPTFVSPRTGASPAMGRGREGVGSAIDTRGGPGRMPSYDTAMKGDVAEGVIVTESSDQIYIDISPCNVRVAPF